VLDVALGWQHSCALLDDATVRCWGRGSKGQLGDGTSEMRSRPAAVIARSGLVRGRSRRPREPVLRGVAQVVAGHDHSCARMKDGTVRCWGDNANGQGGAGPPFSVASPRRVKNLTGVVELASGPYYVCARRQRGGVHCWGANYAGKLAQRNRGKVSTHEQIRLKGLGRVARLALGESRACAVFKDGAVACWPAREFGANGPGHKPKVAVAVSGVTDAVDAVITRKGGCAIRRDGSVTCWGRTRFRGIGRDLAQIAIGRRTQCIRRRNGAMQCRGRRSASLFGVRKVVVGGTHSCAIVEPGRLMCWGATEYGQLGEGSAKVRPNPVRLRGISSAVGLAVGQASCAHLQGGAVRCWGPIGATLGKPRRGRYAAAPVSVDSLRGVVQIAVGGSRLLAALRADGTVLSWDPDRDRGRAPRPLLQLRDVQQVAVGRAHACARRKDGTLWCWGSDEYGVLGRGVPADGKSGTQPPAQVPGLPAVVDVALGEHHSCALGQKGRVRCWGMAEHGRLGNGVTKRHMGSGRPVLVKRLRDVVQLAAPSTGMHTCAVRKDRSVWCWGWNAYGEFGNLKKHRAHGVPVKAKGIHGVQQIATADTTTCGLFAGGQVKCWGGNGCDRR
jgi:alpha-tubulin suppressor-like RCC1 family protein